MSKPATNAAYGLLTLTGLVIANMIGAGVFTTSGYALADLQTPGRVVAAWVVAGGIALCGAITYGALASVLHESGGEYLFLSRWVHPAAGFLAGWVSLLAGFTSAIAFSALTLETYVHPLGGWLAAGAILVSALLHGVRKAPGAWVQNAVLGGKLILLVAFVWIAVTKLAADSLPRVGPAPGMAPPGPLSLSRFAESLMWISLSYAGFNAAVYVAGEARHLRDVPRALWLGTGITMVLYVALNAIFVHAAPREVAGEAEVALIAARALDSPLLVGLTRTLIPLALFTSVSAMMLAGPRVYAQMARDGWLPRWLEFSEERAPAAAILFQAALAILLVWVSSVRGLLTYLGFTLSISSAAAAASLWIVHRRGLARIRSYQLAAASFYVVATLISATLGALLNPRQGLAGILTLAVGGAVYLVLNGRRSGRPEERTGGTSERQG